MGQLFSKGISYLLKRYKLVTLILGVLYLVSLIPIGLYFKVDTSLKTWFLENDPDYADYLNFQDEYGSDELVTAMIQFDSSVFSTIHLGQLKKAEKALTDLPFVASVLSIPSAKYFRSSGNGLKEVAVVKDVTDASKSIKRRLKKMPIGMQQFVPQGEEYTMVYILLKKVDELEGSRNGLTAQLNVVLSDHFNKYHLGGMAIINEMVNKMVMIESAYFSIYTTTFIFLILLFYFKKVSYVLVIMSAVTLPVTFLFAVFFFMGYQLNTIAMVIPTILLVYAVADGVHILNNYLFEKNKNTSGVNKIEQISSSLKYSFKPCFYTSLTTAASYLAFSFSDLKVLKEMGLFAALGILMAFILAFLIIGCGLMWIKNTEKKNPVNLKNTAINNQWFEFVNQFKTPAIIIGTAILLLAIPLLNKITVGDNFMEYMKPSSVVKKDIYEIEKINGGFLPFEFLIQSTDSESIVSRNKSRFIDIFQKKIVKDGLLKNPVSLITLINKIKKNESENILLSILLDDEKALEKILIEKRKEGDGKLNKIINTDLSEIRLTGQSKIFGSHEYREKIKEVENIFNSLNKNNIGLELKPQGFLPLYVKMTDFITSSQISSFLMAFLFAGLCLLICFKNLKIVLLSILPNLIPVAFIAIAMAILNWRLDTATVMIAAIILGIAVDDTIHFLNAYTLKKKQGLSNEDSVKHAMDIAGRAVRITSFALVAGFLIIGFSSIKNLQHFGILSALAVFVALLADLIVLPALLLRFNKG